MTADDRRWKAEMDARTLADANEIRADGARLKLAKKEAQRIADTFAKAAGATGGKVVGKGMVQLNEK